MDEVVQGGRESRGKLLIVTNNLPPVRGGSANVYDSLARGAHGRIVLMAPTHSYADGLVLIGWREHDRRANYEIIRLTLLRTLLSRPSGDLWATLRFLSHDALIRLRLVVAVLRRLSRGDIAGVVIGELVASSWLLWLLSRLRWTRCGVYVHGEEITIREAYDPAFARRRRALLCAERIIVVSRFTASAVADLVGASAAEKLLLIENGVDTQRFRPVPRLASLIDLYGLGGCFTFVSICRLLEKKGIDHAIAAFAQIARDKPDCRFLVVGDGPHRPVLERLAAEHGVTAQIVFAGAVPDDQLTDHYVLGDVFVMPNRTLANGDTEGFGLVFLEANACGIPVIAGRDGGSTDAVRDGHNGLVVDGHAIDAIVQAMALLHADAELRARLRENGLATAHAAAWPNKIEALLAAFDRPG